MLFRLRIWFLSYRLRRRERFEKMWNTNINSCYYDEPCMAFTLTGECEHPDYGEKYFGA